MMSWRACGSCIPGAPRGYQPDLREANTFDLLLFFAADPFQSARRGDPAPALFRMGQNRNPSMVRAETYLWLGI